ncbi:NlpC/P60 family protein [Shimia sp. MMG029]|uniref:NlpC/P60 family protein n=1 Tax=Shimia sp. MMG029 TaxID=3021978 RepID=UPI0022FDF9E1|nr:NlpC/P60 family protein [Shimia sp. MMG029]MDA5555632.1 NlpC/P60 family protein [Shimia sp. MMG029]
MNTADGAQVVAIARRWIGTPYRHQASALGAGADCLGLIRGVWRTLYGQEAALVPPYTRDWSEARGQEVLWQAAARYLIPKSLSEEAAGDVLLFRMKSGAVAKHLGIVARLGDMASVIHAYGGHAVVENALSLPWRRRIVGRFAFPAPEEGNTWQL